MTKAAKVLEKALGAFLFVRNIVDELTGEKAANLEDLIDLTYGHGLIILDEKPQQGQSLEEYLRRQYFGLWLIGRAGKKLHIMKKTEAANRLAHFHSQLNREHDRVLVQWYETTGVSMRVPLHKALSVCPEIIELQVNSRFVAFALGENLTLDFTGLKSDLEQFK